MKNLASPIFLLLFLITSCGTVSDYSSNSKPVSHKQFDDLLQKHVSEAGWVDYEGFIQDSQAFNKYLMVLKKNHPNDKNWNREERMAYWINAYNAFTIKLIMDYYPVESIKDIKSGIPFVNTVWDIKFINIEDRTYDLNNIEHGILRPKFDDPRIHFAVNCASRSCPKLLNRAYTAKNLEKQLDQVARMFLEDESRNIIKPDKLQLSKIFSWYSGDFKDKASSVVDYIRNYTDIKINEDPEIEYLDYSWVINSQQKNQ